MFKRRILRYGWFRPAVPSPRDTAASHITKGPPVLAFPKQEASLGAAEVEVGEVCAVWVAENHS